MLGMLLTQDSGIILGPISKILGYIMEGIFFVIDKLGPEISHTVQGDSITVTACSESGKLLYMDFRVEGVGVAALAKYEELSDAEKQAGVISRPIPADGKSFKVYFENEYGIWTHPMIRV